VSAAAAADDDAPEPFFWRGGDTHKVPVSLHADNRARLREAICASLEARGIAPGIVILQARAGGLRAGYSSCAARPSLAFIRLCALLLFTRRLCVAASAQGGKEQRKYDTDGEHIFRQEARARVHSRSTPALPLARLWIAPVSRTRRHTLSPSHAASRRSPTSSGRSAWLSRAATAF
jgi:hypothetical protein